MTRTTKQQRQRRYRMAKAYLDRRALRGPFSPEFRPAYLEWTRAFPKFMNIAYPGKLTP